MADISIPGVSNKYGTNETIQKLMEVERVPLTREQDKLETYKQEQSAWRDVNRRMSALRESARSLYSFDNPFSSKLSESSDEYTVTAEPTRDASLESFKIKVMQTASADRFLSGEIEKNSEVPEGTYTITVNDKKVSFNWKGGKLSDFSAALNRRSNGIVKSSIIGVSSTKQTLLVEALETGSENRLQFEDDALDFALRIGMIKKSAVSRQVTFGRTQSEISSIPDFIFSAVKVADGSIKAPPVTGYQIPIPSVSGDNKHITFELTMTTTDSPTVQKPAVASPVLPDPSRIQYKGIIIYNDDSEIGFSPENEDSSYIDPVENNEIVYIKTSSGEIPLEPVMAENTKQKYTIDPFLYDNIEAIVIKNRNTEKTVTITSPVLSDVNSTGDYEPVNPVSVADDAKLQYEGINMVRSSNKIDDIVPNVTLNLHEASERPVTITIKADTDSAKDALIQMVGYYNQLMTDFNVLTQNKPELITELEYLTTEESEEYEKKLGMFTGDTTLSTGKSSLQRILTNNYIIEGNDISMLAQIGISTGSASGVYNASRLRGYLEIDEKKLDSVLKENIDEVKDLFGYDSDGDKVIDSGIAYMLDRNLQAYVQTGGILSTKIATLDTRISTTQTSITRLESQLEKKEAEYKRKYGNMESTLSTLESQSTSITNFSDQLSNR
ncbi:MAG: flagellar filament capping protein FliD [Treponemataceae bacterium]|nr:flagellar filament capping protein FliD [Treponemataceae bacterium]